MMVVELQIWAAAVACVCPSELLLFHLFRRGGKQNINTSVAVVFVGHIESVGAGMIRKY